MLSKNVRFPNINYSYWSEKNNYFADIPLIGTIKIGLEHARKGGLVDTALKNANIKTNKNLVDLIESKIKTYPQIEKFEDDELMLIFDLIQAWGGKTGRNIYVKPKGSPTRTSYAKLAATYRNAMSCCTAGDFQSALVKITSIPNIGESFATKHIFFWSEFGPRRKALPIYDTRIKTLLFFKATSASDYNSYDEMLEEGNLVRYFNNLSCSSCGELIYDPKKSFFFPSFEICDQDEADFQLQCLIRALDEKGWKNESLFITVSPGYIAFDGDSEVISDISPVSETVIGAEDIEFSEEFDAFTYDLNVVYKISEVNENIFVQ